MVCSRFTYEIAPVFVLMEQLTLKKMREIVGWLDGEGDGIFSPGKISTSDQPVIKAHTHEKYGFSKSKSSKKIQSIANV